MTTILKYEQLDFSLLLIEQFYYAMHSTHGRIAVYKQLTNVAQIQG